MVSLLALHKVHHPRLSKFLCFILSQVGFFFWIKHHIKCELLGGILTSTSPSTTTKAPFVEYLGLIECILISEFRHHGEHVARQVHPPFPLYGCDLL